MKFQSNAQCPREHTQSSILYPKFPALLWQKIEPFNFIRIMKLKQSRNHSYNTICFDMARINPNNHDSS